MDLGSASVLESFANRVGLKLHVHQINHSTIDVFWPISVIHVITFAAKPNLFIELASFFKH
jgi:hypothetical protein